MCMWSFLISDPFLINSQKPNSKLHPPRRTNLFIGNTYILEFGTWILEFKGFGTFGSFDII